MPKEPNKKTPIDLENDKLITNRRYNKKGKLIGITVLASRVELYLDEKSGLMVRSDKSQ